MNQPDATPEGEVCRIEVSIREHPKRTRAKAKLRWGGRELTGIGIARLNPADRNIAEIGDELAVARALSNLADQLFSTTASDIHAATHEPVVIVH